MSRELRTDIDVRSRASGEQRTFAAGHVVQLRRDPSADFPLRHEQISRRAHAELAWVDGYGWVLRDVSSRAGVFVDGTAQQALVIDRPTLVRLGGPDAGEDVDISPAGAPSPAATAAWLTGPAAMTMAAPPSSTSSAWRLAVTAAGNIATFAHEPLGRVVSVGRESFCDVTIDDPTVSRHHADLISVADGWRYEDRSSGGSWLAGRRKASILIDRTTELKLGEPLTGVPLRLEVSIPPEVERRRARRTRSVKLAVGAGAVAVIAAIATVLALVVGSGGSSGPAATNEISAQTLLTVERATVKLEIIGKDGTDAGWGSGSIIDPHGMILTNSHVADPNALGMDTQYGSPLGDDTPDYLLVELRSSDQDGTVQARYRARKVVSDGYLDLAVVQIYADAQGHPVDPATLNLPTMAVGDSDKLSVGDQVSVVGFPGVSQSRAATVTKGDASAFVRDERLHSDRSWIETTARIAHGNSGGAAVDSSGALIGVPTRIAPEHEGDVGWWFRPINWASKLITLARNHQGADYVTPYVMPATGVTLTPLGWTASKDDACNTSPSTQIAHADAGTSQMYLGVNVTGLQKGLEFNISISGPGDYSLTTSGTSSSASAACFDVPVSFRGGDGRYYVVLSVDPPGSATKYAAIAVGVQ